MSVFKQASAIKDAAFPVAARSMVPLMPHFAAEDPVGPSGVADDQWHGDGDPDEHEYLATFRCGGIPDGKGRRHDIGPDRDSQTGHAEEEHAERQPEGLAVPLGRQRTKQQERHYARCDRHRRGKI